jgi:hypothetical protein
VATLRMTRGDTPTFRIGPVQRLNASDVLEDVDLTGAAATMTVRRSLSASVAFTVAATFDVANAFIKCKPSAANTESLDLGNYVYDVQLTEADGTKTTFPEKGYGKLVLQPDVTHA